MLTPRTPRLTASRNGFLARSTALSWPWNTDRLLAAPGAMPPSFAEIALGRVAQTKPVIRLCCKDPLQREQAEAAPLRPTGAEGLGEVGETPKIEITPAQNPVQRERPGPLSNGNPRGNPNLAPRCGARTRRTGCPCRAPAMRNGRCRLHGGKSTGPRTEEGRARIRAARTRHGLYSAEGRAFQRNITFLLSRDRQLLRLASQPGPRDRALDAEALRHLLPPDLSKHPLHRENFARMADVLPPAPRTAPATAQPAVPVRRPLLLARPTLPEGAVCPQATVPLSGKDPMQRGVQASFQTSGGQCSIHSPPADARLPPQ